jgi:MarR family 2-MHQ and catechol resistance regulon transcriptional repressor
MPNQESRQVATGVHTWLVLWKAARSVEARAHQSIAGTGLCASDFAILETLLHKGPLPVNVIGRKVLLTTGSITTAVDRLSARGFVARKDDPKDRRVRRVELTAEGRKVIRPAFTRHAADLEKVVAVLTAAERSTLVELLRKLGKSAQGADHVLDNPEEEG